MPKAHKELISIAEAIMRDSPGCSTNEALERAIAIYKEHSIDIISADKIAAVEAKASQPSNIKTSRKELPEHIKQTIKRQRKAEKKRKRAGRSLPETKFFSGGTVSPK